MSNLFFVVLYTCMYAHRMPGKSNPGTTIVYEHFGICVFISDDAVKKISIYLDGSPGMDKKQGEEGDELNPNHQPLSSTESLGKISDDEGGIDASQSTMNYLLNLASTNLATITNFIRMPLVGLYEGSQDQDNVDDLASKILDNSSSVRLRRGTIPIKELQKQTTFEDF